MIDGELKRNDYYRNDKVKEYFQKIITISHLEKTGPYTLPDICEGRHPWPGIPD